MAQTPLPNLGVNYEYTLATNNWKNGFDSGMVILDAMAQGFVIDQRFTEPGGPSVGDAYLLTGAPAGANWGVDTGALVNSIALYTNVPGQLDASPWLYIAPREGFSVYDRTLNRWWTYIGTIWVPSGHQIRLEKTEAGVAYTTILEDAGRALNMTAAGTVLLTVDTFANVALPLGVFYDITHSGTGYLEITGAGGVTVTADGYSTVAAVAGARLTLEPNQRVLLWHQANDVWIAYFFERQPYIDVQTGATFEPVMRNANGSILINNAAHTLNIPDEATVPYPVGTMLRFINQNVAAIVVTDDVAVTYATGSQNLATAGIAANASALIQKTGTDQWFVLSNQALP